MPIKIFPFQLKRQIEGIKNKFFRPSLKVLDGNILEVGFGKGVDLKYFNKKCNIYAVDKKVELQNPNVRGNITILKARAEKLPFNDNFFDTVVFSFVLCSVKSEEEVVIEVSRVLKNKGQLILLEHIKSQKWLTKVLQKILNLGLRLLLKECHLDRDPRYYLRKHNFITIEEKIFCNSVEPYLFLKAINNKYRESNQTLPI